ncbi:Guanine nucleotide-binding protein negative regulator 1 [Erysiphe necator]|nr:Guanine nucleotide-binding protein negative regulator 1 [Erysiphe necator]
MEQPLKNPELIASTLETYRCSITESKKREDILLESSSSQPTGLEKRQENQDESNYFKTALWLSPDGTSVLTSNADNTIRTFIIPPNLLSSEELIRLTPYTRHKNPAPVNCLLAFPLFDLSSPSTTLYLSTPNGFPIRMLNALSPSPVIVSSYNLISETTESYITPASKAFLSFSQFFTGSDSLIALFDLSNNGSAPILRLPTIPSKRHRMKGGGVGMRGIVSSMAIQTGQNETLAAGTWTRWVGLYDAAGLGGTIANWSVAKAADEVASIGGSGISQVIWSQCGRYLCVAERMSNGLMIFDVRVTGRLLAWLKGRKASTNQRLAVDLFQTKSGIEVWAGGTDGVVRVWENIGSKSGALERDWEWQAHEDPVTSTAVHSSGTVVATCSGQKSLSAFESSDNDSDSSSPYQKKDLYDNCLKIWRI